MGHYHRPCHQGTLRGSHRIRPRERRWSREALRNRSRSRRFPGRHLPSARKVEAMKPSRVGKGKEFQGLVDEIPTTHIGHTLHKSTELGSHCHKLDCIFIEYYLRVFFFHRPYQRRAKVQKKFLSFSFIRTFACMFS